MRFFSVSHICAGFVAVLVGYTSAAVIIFQAAEAAGASPVQISSWLWALGIGMGVSSIGLSLYFRTPILTAWSTPGAALLVTALSATSLNEAVGIFIFSSSLILLCGITGWFEKIMRHVPASLAGGMLAGVLLQFGMDIFKVLDDEFLLVGGMLAVYMLFKQVLPRYVIPLVLLTGGGVAFFQGQLQLDNLSWQLSAPVWVTPDFSLAQLIGVGIPLFIVTMASQNVPGVAALRANGYQTPVSPLISCTGFTGVVLAPFGGFAFNLAAITAAICQGKEAGVDPDRRYLASVWAGGFYLLTGIFGASVVALFAAFPTELVMALAGLALLGTIGNSLSASLADHHEREAALLTFLVTASGINLAGIGSAFWGLVIGLLAYHLQKSVAPEIRKAYIARQST
ncbi:benzoate/H(+) symporter BenE family transporter [Thalassomonas actiniarum]|uniref:Benzoate/H(+) symporter BenE family transporter n=2 Tax=Thalassomonas actiniarum TaxID=485447 RepID=A0AAF0C5T2_9GAMM|nr:benzoate/H(+) symporter BenE family transporter [Thalassomonas actiniarum]